MEALAGRWQPDASDLAALALELDRRASGAYVQRVYQPAPTVLVFHLYGAGQEMRLVVDTAPGRLAFGLLPESARSPKNPPEPPPFCMMLRKHLEGRRLRHAEAVPGDRVLLLSFGERDAATGSGERRLIESDAVLSVELTGRSANVVLVVHRSVAGWLRQPGPGRALHLHGPYALPPTPRAPAATPVRDSQGERTPSLEETGRAWLAAFERDRLEERRRELLRALGESARRLSRKIQRQAEDLRGAQRADEWRRCGELLLTYATRIPPGASSVVLPPPDEPTGEAALTIRLDPARSASGNAQAYFRRYQKARRAASVLQEQLERSKQLLSAIETLQVLARDADTLQLLEALDAERALLGDETVPARRQARPASKGERDRPKRGGSVQGTPAIARFRSSDGIEILVGRSARANDHLTLHLARPGHLWLHARHLPGAHVVIRSDAQHIPERTLQEAAALAALYSAQGRSQSPIPVDYTLCRHVRKPPGSPPGFVVYDHEKTIRALPDPGALTPQGPLSAGSAGSR